MEKVNNILVVINRSTDANYVMDKAAAIASTSPAGCEVMVIRVIYESLVDFRGMSEDNAQRLKLYLMQAEEEFLVDLLDDHRGKFSSLESATLWNPRVSSAVLDVANDFSADLVIKSADPESPHFPRHPDDWNLVRQATCPVLLVRPEPWVADPVVLAAVDVFDTLHEDMNGRILAAADRLNRALGGSLHVVSAYPDHAAWSQELNAAMNLEKLRHEVENDARSALTQMAESRNVSFARQHLNEGQPARVVADVARDCGAEVVVVGTAGRSGVSGYIIGNTSETLLHTIDRDMLILHV